jgi:hypothetical protein
MHLAKINVAVNAAGSITLGAIVKSGTEYPIPETDAQVYDDTGEPVAFTKPVVEIFAEGYSLSPRHPVGSITDGKLTLNMPDDTDFTTWAGSYLSSDLYGVALTPGSARLILANFRIQSEAGGLSYCNTDNTDFIAYAYFTEAATVSGTDSYGDTVDISAHAGWNKIYVHYPDASLTGGYMTADGSAAPDTMQWRYK